jgi:hypothetical protein
MKTRLPEIGAVLAAAEQVIRRQAAVRLLSNVSGAQSVAKEASANLDAALTEFGDALAKSPRAVLAEFIIDLADLERRINAPADACSPGDVIETTAGRFGAIVQHAWDSEGSFGYLVHTARDADRTFVYHHRELRRFEQVRS